MEDLLFVINAILPIILMIVVGYFLKNKADDYTEYGGAAHTKGGQDHRMHRSPQKRVTIGICALRKKVIKRGISKNPSLLF